VPWEEHHCGHLVDRCAGGTDDPENLAVMCAYVNIVCKPIHHDLMDARRWRVRLMRMVRGCPAGSGDQLIRWLVFDLGEKTDRVE
jgi:hypothetical protein